MEKPEDIARRILESMAAPPETFRHEGYTHVVERSLQLPKDFHHPATRLAPVQINAYRPPAEQHDPTISRSDREFPLYIGGALAVVRSGKWEKYVHDDARGFGLKPNDNRHADADLGYEPVGVLRCNPNIETAKAPEIAAAWLGAICSIVQERRPTDAELQMLEQHRRYKAEHTGFYFVRTNEVRPRMRFMRWLSGQ
jgi:hypothetical protein